VEATTRTETSVAVERSDLAGRYAAALEAYLTRPDEIGLVQAHDLGREALDQGLGVLVMIAVHSDALARLINRPRTTRERGRVWEAAERFAVEAFSPFEMAHRGYWEANAALHRLNELLEGQARRIAGALHDEAGQLLAAVHFALAELSRDAAPEHAAEIRSVRDLLDQTEERLRGLAHELRPPVLSQQGLMPALRFLAESVSKRWGLSVTVDGGIEGAVPATVETTIYRIVQEALANAGKHARAASAQVRVCQTPRAILCVVSDDGVGFAPSPRATPAGLGLVQIREQAAALGGSVRLGARSPHGAELVLEIPLVGQRIR
jgi:signal transduction histidine kinase